jgi:hypothetical protein
LVVVAVGLQIILGQQTAEIAPWGLLVALLWVAAAVAVIFGVLSQVARGGRVTETLMVRLEQTVKAMLAVVELEAL